MSLFQIPKILIVDDSLANRKLLQAIIEEMDIETMEAENGERAIEFALAENCIGVFMDINMPKMGGEEATEILRNINFEPPIIACSAEEDEKEIVKFLTNGFTDFLHKPIEPSDVIQLLEKHCLRSLTKEEDSAQQSFNKKIEELKVKFYESLPDKINAVEMAINRSNHQALKRIAHKMKGTAPQFGLEDIAQTCSEVEEAVKQQDIASATELSRLLLSQLKSL